MPLPSYGPDPVFPESTDDNNTDDRAGAKFMSRISLTHSTGFSNFWSISNRQETRIHFEPGTRYSYSGEGFILLQFVIERGRKEQGLGLDVGDVTNRIFNRLGMTRTSLSGVPVSPAIWPTAGMTRASRGITTNGAACGPRARWTRRSPISRYSRRPSCAATV